MSTLLTYSTAELQSLREWFAATSRELFEAKTGVDDQESKVRLHIAAQNAHHLAVEIERFATAYQALQDDGLIEA